MTSGYLATGVTTIVWGTSDLVANVAGIASIADSLGIVTRFSQRPLVDNIKLPQGDGLTSTRVQIIDGYQWDVTIRDDTRYTARPKIGNTVLIYDGAGFITAGAGGSPTSYIATIVEATYEASPKNPAEFTVTVENLTLITEAAVAT